MENTTELFRVTIGDCNEIKQDLNVQEEKLNTIKERISTNKSLLSINGNLIKNLDSKTSVKCFYLTTAILTIIILSVLFIKYND
ncbi:hypothetical protein A0H76_1230 [Hepatospora eriocheir]|uniref:Uncharacterized protein n=1 Tax=Hepatospora eriocheir TaxID=1081669 RepID=A0A1X0QKT4_9MICR|nr:hypothetical protein A0H76_1230 [Hepatospora eriocheir]